MAGGTKSYKVWKDADGAVRWELVSFHPKYATKPATAVRMVHNSEAVHLAPHDRKAFEELWAKSLPQQEESVT